MRGKGGLKEKKKQSETFGVKNYVPHVSHVEVVDDIM